MLLPLPKSMQLMMACTALFVRKRQGVVIVWPPLAFPIGKSLGVVTALPWPFPLGRVQGSSLLAFLNDFPFLAPPFWIGQGVFTTCPPIALK